MKISYRNYPILEKLQKGSLGILPVFEKDKKFFDLFRDCFVDNWNFYREEFKHDINVISQPFYEASVKAQNKILQLYEDIVINDTSDFDVKGCYLYGDFVYMLNYEVKKGSEDNEVVFYIFSKEGLPLAMFVDTAKYKICQNGWISSYFSVGNNPDSVKSWIFSQIAKIIIFRMFKTYAEVETKIIPPNSKVKAVDCKYVNDTKLKLTYLDSKWFTNLVKSEGFNVRGHFRLQPKKKEGEWTKELIWISDFQKNGYTSPARILSQNGT
jgi:hypothetical protein